MGGGRIDCYLDIGPSLPCWCSTDECVCVCVCQGEATPPDILTRDSLPL